MDKKINGWEKLNYIATIVIAGIAVWGFISSFHSSKQITTTLEKFNTGLSSFTEPIIDFTDYFWFFDIQNPIVGSGFRPIGINMIFTNKSYVPIILSKLHIKIYYSDVLINTEDDPMVEIETLPVNGIYSSTLFFPNNNKLDGMKNKIGFYDPPFLKIELKMRNQYY